MADLVPLLSSLEDFNSFLTRKALSIETKKLYLMYFKKLSWIMGQSCIDLNQAIVDGFLDVYPNIVARAFMRNYLEYRHMSNLIIQKRTGRMQRKEVETISEKDLLKIRTELYVHDERYGLIFDLSEGCALRRQEALNVKASDISIETIEGKDNMFILLKKTKGNKERKVFVPNDVAVNLVKFIAENKLTVGSFLFRSNANPEHSIDKTMWNKAFSKASLIATGRKYHPHQLRHSRSLKWFDKGIDIVRIQQRLGHSNIATTRLYINPDNRKELEKWSRET
jgi:integrase